MTEDVIWFAQPANNWNEALPLGNGSLGAMAFGGPLDDRFQINDETAWSGSDQSEGAGRTISPNGAREAIHEARLAIARGDYAGANPPLQRLQHGHSQSYLPFADLMIEYAPADSSVPALVAEYSRSLDLATGEHRVSFELDGHQVIATSLISRPHGVLAFRLTTDYPGGLNVRARLTSPLQVLDTRASDGGVALLLKMPSDVAPPHEALASGVVYDERIPSMEGAVAIRSQDQCTVTGDNALSIPQTNSATILLATGTTFSTLGHAPRGSAEDALTGALRRLDAAAGDGYDAIRARQRADHGELYGRAHLTTGETPDKPTDLRLAEADGEVVTVDPGLLGLLFNYGRYLLICSSRPGSLPANLQGIWNEDLRPQWSSNYTTNINLPMNYWGAEVANLAECAEPVFELLKTVSVLGAATARRVYASPGWVLHHNTDAWGFTAPVGDGTFDPAWSFWPFGGAWLVQQLGQRMEFSPRLDDGFASEVAWPILRGAADFLLSWVTDVPGGRLGTVPSTSPENRFVSNGTVGSAAVSSGLDIALTRDVFALLHKLAADLDRRDDVVALAAADALDRLPVPMVGSAGTILEWSEEFGEFEPHHRHLSHLYFAYPGSTPLPSPLRDAVIASLEERGDESTGWSLIWKVALRARTRQPEKVTTLLNLMFRNMATDRGAWIGGIYPNLLMGHPPFQIDGNLGFVGAFAESILHSHLGAIELLPALPAGLRNGSARGLVARPGIEVDVEWADGVLSEARFRTLGARTMQVKVLHKSASRILDIAPGIEVGVSGPDLLPTTRMEQK